jgi:DNA-directed RNA polymerase specialized sigma24 family protein
VDLERALATLPDDLRSLWDQRAQGLTLTEISQEQGVPRPTLYDRWAKVCEHLRQAGLARYFESE